LVLFTEALERQPMETLRGIYDFLGVTQDVVPRNLGKRYNVSAAEPRLSQVTPATFVKIASSNRVARGIWHSLSSSRRSSMLGWYRHLNFRFGAWNRRGSIASQRSDDDLAALERLRKHYASDGEQLTALLGHAPPWTIAEEAPAPTSPETSRP